jgi:hypothetical protein
MSRFKQFDTLIKATIDHPVSGFLHSTDHAANPFYWLLFVGAVLFAVPTLGASVPFAIFAWIQITRKDQEKYKFQKGKFDFMKDGSLGLHVSVVVLIVAIAIEAMFYFNGLIAPGVVSFL